jgi:cytochrome b subunit of formate dehydrogenase
MIDEKNCIVKNLEKICPWSSFGIIAIDILGHIAGTETFAAGMFDFIESLLFFTINVLDIVLIISGCNVFFEFMKDSILIVLPEVV